MARSCSVHALASLPTFQNPAVPEINKLEFLYWESLLRAQVTKAEQKALRSRLSFARLCRHYSLIGMARSPRKPYWIYTPRSLEREIAVNVIKPFGEIWRPHEGKGAAVLIDSWKNNRTRLILDVDPNQPDSVLFQRIKREIRQARKAIGRTRSPGGGRRTNMQKLAQALDAYDVYQSSNESKKVKILNIVERHTSANSRARNPERDAYRLIRLATRMIEAAKAGPEAWARAFPLH